MDDPRYESLRKRHYETFHSSLNEIKKDGSCTDVIIICGNKEFPVHKLILMATCSYFRHWFKSQSQASQPNRIEMPSIPSSVMETIIDFMYFNYPSGILDEKLENVIEILKASHTLGYESLSKECWFKIKNELSTQNYAMIWDLCSLYEQDKCIEHVVLFILENLKDVLSDYHFLELSTGQISRLLEVANQIGFMKEDILVKGLLVWVNIDALQRQSKLSELFNHVNLHTLSLDYLNYLTKEEPLIYNDRDVLLKLLSFSIRNINTDIPKLENESINTSSTSENIIAYFLGFRESSSGQGFIQKVELRNQNKEPAFALPFPLTTKKTTYIRSGPSLSFIGDKDESLSCSFCCYNIETNECIYKSYFTASEDSEKIFSFVDNKDRVCVGNVFQNKKNAIRLYNEDLSKWVPFFEMPENYTICSNVNVNDDLYVLVFHNRHTKREFRVFKEKNGQIVKTGEHILLSSAIQPNLVAVFDDKFYLFEFNEKVSRCVIHDPLSKEWKSVALDFHLPNPISDWTTFTRKEFILFFSYKKAFSFYPKTNEIIDVCGETCHELCNDSTTCESSQTPSHVYMWVD